MTTSPSISPPPRLSAESVASPLSWSPDEQRERLEAEDAEIEENTVVTPALMRIAAVAGLGGLLFGYDTGVVSGALLVIHADLGGSPLSTTQEGMLVSSALLGALVGSLLAGRSADRFGRKPVILVAAVLFTLGALEQAAAQVYKEVIFGRVLVGIGVGLASSVLPIFLAEVSPAKYRGRIVASLVVLITGGQVLSYIVDAVFYSVPSGWRWMFGSGAIPSILQLCLSFSIPESPRWLIQHGRIAPARATLKAVYPLSDSAAIQRRIERIEVEVQSEEREGFLGLGEGLSLGKAKEGLVARLWNDRANRRAIILACGLQFFQQATGFNLLMYFSGKVLQAAHFGRPAAFALVVAVSNFICTIIALRLIDHLGRRPLLLRTLVGMIVGMLLLSFSFFFIPPLDDGEEGDPTPQGPSAWAYLSLLGMTVFCSSYALGLGNVPWVIQSEVFTHELRATGTSLATATNWNANLIVAATFLHLAQALTVGGAFLVFAVITIAAWLFTYRYLPETKGLSLEATRALFEREAWYRDEEGQGGVGSGARYQSVASEEVERSASEGDGAEGERRADSPSP
ncbi:general substrate transporter [Leucosporidium creatinivorum]|uniref:General substrate transporter n=1 Tax=Leucosporidium creatinivorum TaxID=106004 RepID=A0A1Y2E2C9_9BASI|nr:general substrate transporter [Leucosporidium creatinivorum]